ncbi:MAG: CHASE2 domain-containing protein, partial [Phycisphaerae bacterium]|nr:CHASE2 domain-containing protein [Phycisphaerae bacterium]
MRSTTRAVLLASLAVTLLVAVSAWLGAFDKAEWWTQDLRFTSGRIHPTHLSDQVRLVAIDDRALDTIGRWPWDRDVFGLALTEIARAGARTVATDVLFTEPQGRRLAAQASPQDIALARSVAAVPTVLAAHMDEGRLLGEAWQGAEGRKILSELSAIIAADVTADAGSLADRVGLEGVRRSSFLVRPSAFKKYALWHTLISLRRGGRSPEDLAAFRSMLTGGDRALGAFAEELLAAEAFDRDRSFGALTKFMIPGVAEGSPLDAPPIAVIAIEAGALGFVNSLPDGDGYYRRVRPTWPTPYGAIPQMGLAAAMLQERMDSAAMRVDQDRIILPNGRVLPLVEGMLYVDWPNDMFEPVGATEYEPAHKSTGVVAIGRLVDVARQRAVLAGLEDRYRAIMRDIVELQNLTADAATLVPVSSALREVIKEHGEFLAGDLADNTAEAQEGLSDEERRIAGVYKEWWRLDQDIPKARDLISRAESELRSELEGKLVFVGFMATGVMADMINTVYGPRTPGVYFHAAIASMTLEGRTWVIPDPWVGVVAGLFLAVLASV